METVDPPRNAVGALLARRFDVQDSLLEGRVQIRDALQKLHFILVQLDLPFFTPASPVRGQIL
jgi:hypothetical protein